MPDHSTGPDTDRLIVGVGASAGGLEAFQQFLAALPNADGLAIVFVQHLDPGRDSLLVELLSKSIDLPILPLTDHQHLEAGSVYVRQPGTEVNLHQGVAIVTGVESPRSLSTVIDHFFHSLADDQGSNSVGIVLSGSGADGTLGLKRISDTGGLTFAQDPGSSKFDSMPRNAATTGVADHVMEPAAIARELVRYRRHIALFREQRPSGQHREEIEASISDIAEKLDEVTGHDFQHYKPNTLVRRISRRMQVLKIADTGEYMRLLQRSREECETLFRELLIGVTAFFRDPPAFESLSHSVLSQLIHKAGPDDTVRIWIPGCATGEEAYSLAILCREWMERREISPQVRIFATDIDTHALHIARQGNYPLSIESQMSPERLKKYFVRRGNRYQVVKEARDLVLFSSHNLINDPPFSRLDLISCRNLLIYLGPHLQNKLIPLFHYALRRSGFLFLGPSENITSHGELFRPVDAKHRISQRKGTAVAAASRLSYRPGGPRPHLAELSSSRVDIDLSEYRQKIVLDEFAPQSVIVDESGQIINGSENLQKYLRVCSGDYHNNVVKMAVRGLQTGLRSALAQSRENRRKVQVDHLSIQVGDNVQQVMLTVQPMPNVGEEDALYLIVFQDIGLPIPRRESGSDENEDAERPHDRHMAQWNAEYGQDADTTIAHLEKELEATRDELERSMQEMEAANEELKSSNEELLSMNEELQSANEELETTKEEIRSSSDAVARVNNDLENLLRSTRIATIFLDGEGRIRSFTPAVQDLYGLIDTDVGRPLTQLMPKVVEMPPIPDTQTLREREVVEDTIQAQSGKAYIRRVLPYRSHEGIDEGVVVTFTDVTELQASEQRLAWALDATSSGTWDWDIPSGNVILSDRWIETLGYHRDEIPSHIRFWESILHPDDVASTQEALEKHFQGETDLFYCENRLRTASGEYRWNLARGRVVGWDKDGKPQRIIGTDTDITVRKTAEENLASREAQMRTITNALPVEIAYIDTDEIFQFANAVFAAELSRPMEEIVGRSVKEVFGDSSYADMAPHLHRGLSGESFTVEVTLNEAGTSAARVKETTYIPQYNPDGSVRGCHVMEADVTEKKRWEAELSSREAHLRRVIDNIVGFVGVLDPDGTLLEVNERALSAGGVRRDEVIGKTFWQCPWWDFDPKVSGKLQDSVRRAAKGESVRYDTEIRTANDNRMTVDFMLVPVRDEQGEITYLIPSGYDVTTRRKTEVALRRQEKQLKVAMDAGRLGAWEWSLENDRIVWSEQLFDILGYRKDQFTGDFDSFLNLIHANDREAIREKVATAIESNADDYEVEFRVCHGLEDRVVWLHGRASILRDDSGRAVRMIGVASDITTLKQRELNFAMLAEIQAEFAGDKDIEATLQKCCATIAKGLDLSTCCLVEIDSNAENANIFCEYTVPDSPSTIGHYRIKDFHTEEDQGRLARGETLVINDTKNHGNSEAQVQRFLQLGAASLVNTAYVSDQGMKFVLAAYKANAYTWQQAEIEMLEDLTERLYLRFQHVRSESRLQESEQKLRAIYDGTANFTGLLTLDGAMIEANAASLRFGDFDLSDVIGKPYWETGWFEHTPGGPELVRRHFDEATKGKIERFELALVLPDGKHVWHEFTFFPIKDEAGKTIFVVPEGRNVADQKLAQKQLAESNSRLLMATTAAHMGVFQWDPVSGHADWDEQWIALLGRSHQDGPGQAEESLSRSGETLFRNIHPSDQKLFRAIVDRVTNEGGEYDTEVRILSPDGEVRWLSTRGKWDPGDDVRPGRLVGLFWDITEQKEQERRVHASEERLRLAAAAAGFGTYHIDLVRQRVIWSAELKRLVGIKPHEEINYKPGEIPSFVHPEDRAEVERQMAQACSADGKPRHSFLHRIVLPDDRVRWVKLQGKTVYKKGSRGKRPTQVIGTLVDVTKQKEFEESLEKAIQAAEAANESKSEFLANMSHEIRTPMTAILGYADLLFEQEQDEEKIRYLQTIRRNGKFLLGIINDILDLSKIEAKKLQVQRERFAPHQLVEDVRSIMEVRAKERDLDLNVDYEGKIPADIESDPKRLKQILVNLVGNAIKFTEEGNVNIVVRYDDADEGRMHFEVTDSGIGMSEEQLARLFLPFSQGDAAVNRRFGGTGLGLAISQRLAHMLGGEIQVESVEGEGSTFTCTVDVGDIEQVPLITPCDATDTSGDPTVADQVELDCHILVVDDRRDIRFLSNRLLTRSGARVDEAEDGEVALKLVTESIDRSEPYDLILLDMQMPNLDGYQTATKLRRLGFDAPIIALTADAMQGDMRRCLASGCNAYLSKPIDRQMLLDMVVRYIQR